MVIEWQGFAFRVRGRVQGVFFRAHAQKTARDLGLVGYIQNEADGSVLGEAWGSASAILNFRTWLWQGPPAAKVTDVTITPMEGQAREKYEDFTIRR